MIIVRRKADTKFGLQACLKNPLRMGRVLFYMSVIPFV